MTRSSAETALGFTAGDVVVVTGAGSGIGRATALAAGRAGLTVAVWDIDLDTARTTAGLLRDAGHSGLPLGVDIADGSAVETAMTTTRRAGPVRHLVNNAGPASTAGIAFGDAMRIGLGGTRTVTECFLRTGTARSLVNVASVAGTVTGSAPDWCPALKAGIAGYTRHLATHRTVQVRANAVAPGLIDTPRMAEFARSALGTRIVGRVPEGRAGRAEEVAGPILFLLSPLASYVRGVVLVIDGGATVAQ